VAAGQGLAGCVDGGAAEQRVLEFQGMAEFLCHRRKCGATPSAVTSPPIPSPASTAMVALTTGARPS